MTAVPLTLRSCSSLALVLASLSLAACNPCVERCRVESRNIESCLDDWNLDWGQLGASSAKDFKEQCVATERLWIDSLSGEERAAEQDACWELTTALRSADDCDERWAALSGYGDAS
jgi:hypothetical protein